MFFNACSGRDEVPFEFRETPVLVGQESFALITERYARLHQEADIMAPVIAHARAGDVLEVVGTTADRQWTELKTSAEQGWVQSLHIRRFSNRRQAVNARSLLDE
jgi:SH3-like domain-containing protein